MKDIELLVDSPERCRGITDTDSFNKYVFVACALYNSKGDHPRYRLWKCCAIKHKITFVVLNYPVALLKE